MALTTGRQLDSVAASAKTLDLLPAPSRAFLTSSNSTLTEAQEFQALHDAIFHKDVMSWPLEKQLEHCQFHLTKLAGLLATICEKKHHGEQTLEAAFVRDRIADLLVFALKLANLYEMDLEKAYKQRLSEVELKKLA